MSKKTVVIELDFTYTPNEEDVYVYLKELIKDRSLSWEFKKDDEIERLRELLKKCQPYIAGWPEARVLFREIQKERI